jgi:transcriptional regulator with XRE-family HTH domain
MARRDPETDPRAFLGRELTRVRKAAGFSSQDALAASLGFDRTVIAKAETGDRPPTEEVLEAWCDACKLDPGLPELLRRWAVFARRTDGPVPTWFEDYLEAEQASQSLLVWSPIVIPGLLQTAEYARSLLLAQQTDTSDEAIDALVNARLDRQAIFDRTDPPDVTIVLDEAVLHRLIGTPATMHDTLIHVAEMALRPNIVVQVVPATKGANAGIGGAFDIASADGTPDTLRMDGVEDQTTENRSLVRKHAVAFNRVRGDALSRDASRDLILKVAEQWKTT